MTAIGNPQGFVTTCNELGVTIAGTRFFPDHHHFTDAELKEVQSQAEQLGAGVILTTLKDLVKISAEYENVSAVLITTVFDGNEQTGFFQAGLQAMKVSGDGERLTGDSLR